MDRSTVKDSSFRKGFLEADGVPREDPIDYQYKDLLKGSLCASKCVVKCLMPNSKKCLATADIFCF